MSTRAGKAPVSAADSDRKLGFYLTLPAQILVLFIALFPLLMQLYISLTDWSPLTGRGWWDAWAFWNPWQLSSSPSTGAGGRAVAHRAGHADLRAGGFLLGLALATLFIDNFRGKGCSTRSC